MINRRSFLRNIFATAVTLSALPPSKILAQQSSGLRPVAPGNTYFVGPTGCDFTTIGAAITAINAGTAPTSTIQATIYVYPGSYTTTSAITVPQYVNIVGVNKWSPVQLKNNTTDLFTCSGFNTFQNLVVLQGTGANWAFNCGNNTDITILDCNMWGQTVGTGQGFVSADGTSYARITIQDCTVNSFATSGYICSFVNRTTTVRFVDCWIKNCFFDTYQLTTFGGSIITWGVQDFRVEYCTLRGANTWNTGVRLGLAPITSGTPQVEIRHCYTTGGTSLFNESGTEMIVIDSDCAGASFSGTTVQHNSYTGAAYNPLGAI